MSESLTGAHLIWAIEQMSDERMSEFPTLHKWLSFKTLTYEKFYKHFSLFKLHIFSVTFVYKYTIVFGVST